ncbi:putative Clp, repeat (R) domain, Clp domain superfamily protein [Helianthus annuus]|nr:putative Clp, repeat (R) domain, Clp domain superfamily protein [Helianthus annuus]KAJ0746614.1 putative Clp, repeat (R) domain, Clp domain superfamily protein [Helianthus annuus]
MQKIVWQELDRKHDEQFDQVDQLRTVELWLQVWYQRLITDHVLLFMCVATRSYYGYQIYNPQGYTEMAWERIVGATDAAQHNKQQIIESEHLMKALLEQKDGLARRILTKAALDNTSVLQATDNFIAQQPKVSDPSNPRLGTSLGSLLENARKFKKQMGNDFISVEHLVLAFPSDTRFGKQLFTSLNLSEKSLKEAVEAVRENQKVTDQNPEGKYEALDKYGNDLTELARKGKLDPVIVRDDEI